MKVTQKLVASINHAIKHRCPADYINSTIDQIKNMPDIRAQEQSDYLVASGYAEVALDIPHEDLIEQSSICINVGILYAIESVVERFGKIIDIDSFPVFEVQRSKDMLLCCCSIDVRIPRTPEPYTGDGEVIYLN